MCRLYGMRSTHPTRVGCELIDAQNSLIRQSVEDGRGLSNPHGWGVGYWRNGAVSCERQVGPASQSEAFRRHAVDIEAPTLLAHVRRATVGEPKLSNTHPFLTGDSMLAHNGHIDYFDRVRERMFEEMPDEFVERIQGDTDSEHFFQFLRYRRRRAPESQMRHVLVDAIRDIREWVWNIDPDAEVALNILWTEGRNLAGARAGRTLYYTSRREPRDCPVCGRPHAGPDDDEPYYVVELASERLTDERWRTVPEDVVFDIDFDLDIDTVDI